MRPAHWANVVTTTQLLWIFLAMPHWTHTHSMHEQLTDETRRKTHEQSHEMSNNQIHNDLRRSTLYSQHLMRQFEQLCREELCT